MFSALMLAVVIAVPGGVAVIELPNDVTEVRYLEDTPFVHAGRAIIPIPMNAELGPRSVIVQTQSRGTYRETFEVVHKDYPEQRLTIENRRMVNPLEQDLSRIREEGRRMRRAYALRTPLAGSLAPFVRPVDGIVSSPFGFRRVLNGQPRNPHSGLDIAADTGTPIVAPSPGTIAVTGDFFFNGNTVLVDHGDGLVTMFCHMSAIEVTEGQRVERGDLLGLVGATGRVTGPHLHWSVSLRGVRIDPVAMERVLNAAVSDAADGE